MVNRLIGLSIISSIMAVSFSFGQSIKLMFGLIWLIIFLVFIVVILGQWKSCWHFIEDRLPPPVCEKVARFNDFWANYTRYIFLLRVPIISGLIVFSFPIIANTVASKFLQNLFAMRSNWQLFFVMIASTLTSILIVSLSKTILALDFEKNLEYQRIRLVLSIIIVIPTWISIYINSYPKDYQEDDLQLISFILGLIINFSLFILVALYDWREQITSDKFTNLLNKFPNSLRISDLKVRREKFTLTQTAVGLILYILVIFAYRPESKGLPFMPEAPALLYLFLLIWILTFLLGIATFLSGKSFPVLIVIVVFMVFNYAYWQVDHFFELKPIQRETEVINYQEEFKTAIQKRLSHQVDEEKTLVVVAASGGGIQASGWTTKVLAGLQEELGEPFTNAIGLISSVSGGSVGTMFYLDQFEPGKSTPTQENLKSAFCNSTDDWLDAVGWGLASFDLFRFIVPPINYFNKYLDRGYSLEKDWEKNLSYKDCDKSPKSEFKITTLEDWHKRILDGEIPIPVFNSTLVENGSRFLISPMKFIPGEIKDYIKNTPQKENETETQQSGFNKKALDFKTLYRDACNYEKEKKDCDMSITTAARLSASFPYVTPMALNYPDNKIIDEPKTKTFIQNYHMADGGYFDNYGSFTALEWLNELLESSTEKLKIKKVLFIQINAFPDEQFKEQEKGGLGTIIIGPLQALYGVRDSTQRARNNLEYDLLKERWKNDVRIERFVFTFPEPNDKDYNPPLSWRLTKKQKEDMKTAWNDDKIIHNEVNRIKEFWQ